MAGSAAASPLFNAVVQASAGAAGGVFAAFVLMPLEVAKTRIQISQSAETSTRATLRDIFKEEGAIGLYRGVVMKCTETGTKNFVFFFIYDAVNMLAKRRQLEMTMFVKLGLGYVSGVGQSLLTMPLEVLSTRVQAEAGAEVGPAGVLRGILAQEGVAGLFTGLWYNIALCVNPAIQNTVFDKLKESLLKLQRRRSPGKRPILSSFQAFVLGAVAKVCAMLVTFPLVRLKTMLQAGKQPVVPREEEEELRRQGSEEELGVGRSRSTPILLRWMSFTTSEELRRQGSEEELGVGRSRSTPILLRRMSFTTSEEPQGLFQRFGQLYRGIGSALLKNVMQAALLYSSKDYVAMVVERLFRISVKMMRRRDGQLKLMAWSGRPLPS